MELTPAALRAFAFDGRVQAIAPQPGGHINRSYCVETAGAAGPRSYLLQQLNPRVFRDPAAVMSNIGAVTAHIATHRAGSSALLPAQRRLTLVPTTSGNWFEAPDGTVWRAFPFIRGARVRTRAETPAHAEAAGLAFGAFLSWLSSYDGPALTDTIPHFHDTDRYFDGLERAAQKDAQQRLPYARAELRDCLGHRDLVASLPRAGDAGIPRRVVHNDAKLANVLLDAAGERPVAVIDLDTVMQGSALSDAGDLLRSLASPTEEDETELGRVRAEPEFVRAVLTGWVTGAAETLSATEREAAVLAGCVITLEQAVRFLTDYLVGDSYYGAADPEQNLRRTRTQLRLLDSLLAQRSAFERVAAGLTPHTV